MLTTPPPLFGVVASRRGRAVRYDGARVLGGAFAARHGEKKIGFGSTRARQVAFRSRDHILGSSWLAQPCNSSLVKKKEKLLVLYGRRWQKREGNLVLLQHTPSFFCERPPSALSPQKPRAHEHDTQRPRTRSLVSSRARELRLWSVLCVRERERRVAFEKK